MSKQDRQGVRQASDLEQKYSFGKTFAEIMGIATDAQKKAYEANNSYENLDHDTVFNLLTNNGTLDGLYRGDDGELYINATYIKSGTLLADLIKTGTLTSTDGTVKVDLNNNKVTIDGTRDGYKTQIVLSSSGLNGYGEDTEGVMRKTLDLQIGSGNRPTWLWNMAYGAEHAGLSIGTVEGGLSIGETNAETTIYGKGISLISNLGSISLVSNVFNYDGETETEYYTPPMIAGTEYRTAEQFLGKPVYTTLVDCGGATDGKTVAHNVPTGCSIIRFAGTLGEMPLPINWDDTYKADVTVTAEDIRIHIGTSNYANRQVYVQLWYTK